MHTLTSKLRSHFPDLKIPIVLYMFLTVGGFLGVVTMAMLPASSLFPVGYPHFLAWMAFFCSAFLPFSPSPFLWIILGEFYDTLLDAPAGLTSTLLLTLSITGTTMRLYPRLYRAFVDWGVFSLVFIITQSILGGILAFSHRGTHSIPDIIWQLCLTISIYPLLTSLMLALMGFYLKKSQRSF